MALARESTLLLYTDGLVERRDEPLEDGLARLARTLTELVGQNLDCRRPSSSATDAEEPRPNLRPGLLCVVERSGHM